MSRIYRRKDRRSRDVYYIDYAVCHPETGEQIRKRERVGYSRPEAKSALESRKTDIRRGKFDGIFPAPTCKLEEMRDQYLKYSHIAKRARTAERDEGIIDRLLIPAFGGRSLSQIWPEHVEDYRVSRKSGGIAPATINKEVQLLKHIVKKGVEWGKVRTNRIECIKPLTVPPGRVRYLELEEIPVLLEACPAWLKPIVIIGMHTGLRRSEIITLRRSDIDKKNRLLVITQTKNNELKAVPMNETVWKAIKGLPNRLDTPYLFAEPDGRPVTPNKVSMAFRRARKRAGLDDFRLHDLRHHFASYLTMNGHNSKTVQDLLGHKVAAMTARYSHLSPEHLKAAVASLDDEMSSGTKG